MIPSFKLCPMWFVTVCPIMKILTWNVDSLATKLKDSQTFSSFLDGFEADIICLQEIKATKKSLKHEFINVPGWNSFYSLQGKNFKFTKPWLWVSCRCFYLSVVCDLVTRFVDGLISDVCPTLQSSSHQICI